MTLLVSPLPRGLCSEEEKTMMSMQVCERERSTGGCGLTLSLEVPPSAVGAPFSLLSSCQCHSQAFL